MPIQVILPKVDMDMSHARLVEWRVADGQPVEAGDVLFDMETDKSTMEVEADASGTLGCITGRAGSDIAVGTTIAWLFQEGEDRSVDPGQGSGEEAGGEAGGEASGEASGGPGEPSDEGSGVAPLETPIEVEVRSSDVDASPLVQAPRPAGDEGRQGDRAGDRPVRATPRARWLARRGGIDLSGVKGAGPRGRIAAADLRRFEATVSTANDGQGDAADPSSDPLREHDGLAYRVSGVSDAQPCLLVHGFAGDSSVWSVLAAQLSRRGHRVVSVDLPGHGHTRHPAGTVASLGTGMPQLVERCFGKRPVHLVAHSLGAVPALQLAERVPVSTMTLLAPAGMSPTIDASFVQAMAAPTSIGELRHQLRKLCERPTPLSDAAVQVLFDALRQGRLIEIAGALIARSGASVDIVDALDALSARVACRVIVGHRDRIIDWRDACRLSSRVAVHHLPRAGHLPQWDAPDEVLDIILSATDRAAGHR